jgi:hypothetical protein
LQQDADFRRCTLQANQGDLPLGYLLAIFVGVWVLLSFLFSLMDGWHALSRRFRRSSEPYGETRSAGPFYYRVRMRFGMGYGGVVRLTAGSDALYLSMLFLLRIGHPPLCIPWNEIKFSRTKFLWLRYVALTLGAQERIPMRISERMARKLGILERLPGASDLALETDFETRSESFIASQRKKPN